MYHTDGAARVFLPDLIDRVGIEILNPIQWRCPGMERERLVADFGGRIIFHGSIDNQQTLPFGTVDDVVREVRESVDIYRSARWICGPATTSSRSADGEHRGDVRDDPRNWRAVRRLAAKDWGLSRFSLDENGTVPLGCADGGQKDASGGCAARRDSGDRRKHATLLLLGNRRQHCRVVPAWRRWSPA